MRFVYTDTTDSGSAILKLNLECGDTWYLHWIVINHENTETFQFFVDDESTQQELSLGTAESWWKWINYPSSAVSLPQGKHRLVVKGGNLGSNPDSGSRPGLGTIVITNNPHYEPTPPPSS